MSKFSLMLMILHVGSMMERVEREGNRSQVTWKVSSPLPLALGLSIILGSIQAFSIRQKRIRVTVIYFQFFVIATVFFFSPHCIGLGRKKS